MSDKPSKPIADRPIKKRRTHKAKMIRITLNLSPGLLDKIDEAAEKDFTTRSETIRMAVLWYLRPQGRELQEVDPDVILETLKRRKALRELNRPGDEDYLLDEEDFEGLGE